MASTKAASRKTACDDLNKGQLVRYVDNVDNVHRIDTAPTFTTSKGTRAETRISDDTRDMVIMKNELGEVQQETP